MANNIAFKSFKYKTRLIGNTVVDRASETLRNSTIPVLLKYLSNCWRLLEMLLIICKAELKIEWSNHCVLFAKGNDNDDANFNNNNIFIIKDTRWYVPVVTLLVGDNQSLTKRLSRGFKRSVYWNEYKTKSENQNSTNEYKYFLESNFAGVCKLLVLGYSNQDDISERYKAKIYCLLYIKYYQKL